MANRIIVGRENCTIEKVFRILRFDPSFPLFFEKWSSFAYSLEVPILLVKKIRSDLLVDKNGLEDAIVEILVRWVADNGSHATLYKLVVALELNELNSCSESIRLEFNLPCKKFEDDPTNISWNEIGIPFQQKVVDNLAKFYADIDCSPVLSKLTGPILGDLMIGKRPLLYNSTLPDPPPYYVTRTIKGKDRSFTEDELLQLTTNSNHKSVIICGDEYMGKTTLLGQIGKKFQLANPEIIAIYAKLKTLIERINLRNGSLRLEKSLLAVQAIVCKNELGRFMLDKHLKNADTAKIHLFIDEIDAIQDNEQELAYEMFRIMSGFAGARIWITTCSRHLDKLVKISNVESFSIEKLNEAGQLEVMTSYWKLYTLKDKQLLLDLAKQSVKNLNLTKKYNLWNPLQCLLVAAAVIVDKTFEDSKSCFKLHPENVLDLSDVCENVLLDAASYRSFRTLELILNLNKFNIDCKNSFANSPLFFSVYEENNVDCVTKMKLLISRGANLNHLNKNNNNLLHYAAKHASVESLAHILNLNKFDINCVDIDGISSLFYSVYETFNVDCLLKLKLLIERGANLNHLGKNNNNLLHSAAGLGSVECLTYILNLNKFDINSVDINGNPPLFFSVDERSNVDCLPKMKLLIERGANLNHLNKNKRNWLIFAAKYASVESLTCILNLNKFVINCVDIDENSPLFYSVSEKYNVDCLAKMKLLIERGANLNHLNKINFNLLIFAANFASVECLTYILNLNKFDINCVDINGNSPLFFSVYETNHADCLPKLKLLIKRGARLKHLNKNRSNLLHFAASFGSIDVLEHVLNLGQFGLNDVNRFGRTALDCAKITNSGLNAEIIQAKVKLLIEKGCEQN